MFLRLSFTFILTYNASVVSLERSQILFIVNSILNLSTLLTGLNFQVKLGPVVLVKLFNCEDMVMSQTINVQLVLVTGDKQPNGTLAVFGIISTKLFNEYISTQGSAILLEISSIFNLINFSRYFPGLIAFALLSSTFASGNCKQFPRVISKKSVAGTSAFSTSASTSTPTVDFDLRLGTNCPNRFSVNESSID